MFGSSLHSNEIPVYLRKMFITSHVFIFFAVEATGKRFHFINSILPFHFPDDYMIHWNKIKE